MYGKVSKGLGFGKYSMESDRAASVGMGETVNPSRVRLRLQLNEQKYQHVRAGRGEVSKADGGKMRARGEREGGVEV